MPFFGDLPSQPMPQSDRVRCVPHARPHAYPLMSPIMSIVRATWIRLERQPDIGARFHCVVPRRTGAGGHCDCGCFSGLQQIGDQALAAAVVQPMPITHRQHGDERNREKDPGDPAGLRPRRESPESPPAVI